MFFNLKSQVLFLKLSFQPFIEGILVYKFREHVVFDQLLCQRTGAFGEVSGSKADNSRTGDSLKVDTVVVIKTLILDRNESMLQVLGDFVGRFINAVRAGSDKFLDLCRTVICIDRCGIALWLYAFRSDLRSVIYDPFGKNAGTDHARDSDYDQAEQECFEQADADTFALHGGFGRYLLLFLRSFFPAIIHEF